MTKRVKAINTTTREKKSTTIVDFYPDMFFMKQKPVSQAYVERLAREMIEWAKGDKALRITQFWNERGIPNKYLYDWGQKWPFMKEAHELVMSMLADRREIGGLEKRYDSSLIKETMGMYDPKYREFMEWKSKLAKQEDQIGNIRVVIEKFPTKQEIGE